MTKVKYGKNGRKLKNPKYITESGYIVCDSCHYITEDPNIDDCNYSTLPCKRNSNIERKKYTKENILAFVNEYCNADFNEIVILDDLAGYRVFADGKRDTQEMYNFGDVFQYDEELTHKRREKVESMKKEFCQLFNQKYDNTSYYIEDGKLIARIGVSDNALKKAKWNKGRKFIVEL